MSEMVQMHDHHSTRIFSCTSLLSSQTRSVSFTEVVLNLFFLFLFYNMYPLQTFIRDEATWYQTIGIYCEMKEGNKQRLLASQL